MNQTSIKLVLQFIIPCICILAGLRIIIRKKPIIFDYRWYILLYVLFLVTISFDSLFIFGGSAFIIPSLIIIVSSGYFYFFKKGYFVLGANEKDFFDVLVEGLKHDNYEFEQSSTSINIKEPLLEISINPGSISGSDHIKISNQENVRTFNKIIKEMKDKKIKTKLIAPIFHIVFGILMLSVYIFNDLHRFK